MFFCSNCQKNLSKILALFSIVSTFYICYLKKFYFIDIQLQIRCIFKLEILSFSILSSFLYYSWVCIFIISFSLFTNVNYFCNICCNFVFGKLINFVCFSSFSFFLVHIYPENVNKISNMSCRFRHMLSRTKMGLSNNE